MLIQYYYTTQIIILRIIAIKNIIRLICQNQFCRKGYAKYYPSVVSTHARVHIIARNPATTNFWYNGCTCDRRQKRWRRQRWGDRTLTLRNNELIDTSKTEHFWNFPHQIKMTGYHRLISRFGRWPSQCISLYLCKNIVKKIKHEVKKYFRLININLNVTVLWEQRIPQ